MSDHSTAAFPSEAGLVEALNEVKHAIHCALTSGRVAHYMNKIDITLRRALRNQAEGTFADVFDRPEYRIIWYFFMQWTIFSETPGGDAKIFWHKERASVIAQRLWTPPIPKAVPTTAEAQATGHSVPTQESVVPPTSSARQIAPPPTAEKPRQTAPATPALPPTSSARQIAPPPMAEKPRQVAPPTESVRSVPATVQYGARRGPTHNNNGNNKLAPHPKTGHRLPSQIAADARMSQAPRPAAPGPSQRPAQRQPGQKTAVMPTGRAAVVSGPQALSADMGRMSLTPSLSRYVAFDDVNDDSDEYIPTEEEQNERKRKHQRSSEDPRPKKMRTDQEVPAEDMEADELPGESMDTAPDGKKGVSRSAGIATQFVYVRPCQKCVQRSKVCRVQAGQSGDKPAAACIPCNASKVKCGGQGTHIMVKAVDNEPDVQGNVVESLTIRPGRKGPKKKVNDTVVVVEPGASGYAEANDATPQVRRPIRVESRSPTPPPKPKSAKSRPMPTIIVPETNPSTPEPSLSIVHGLLVEMLGKKFDELAQRLEGRFEERFDELAERLEKRVAQGMGQLADLLDETLEERFSLIENAIVDIKTAAVSEMLSGELSPEMTGNSIAEQSPPLPTVIVTAPTPSQSQESCAADIDMDAEDSGECVTEGNPTQSGSPVPSGGKDDMAGSEEPLTNAPLAPDDGGDSNMSAQPGPQECKTAPAQENLDPIPEDDINPERLSLALAIDLSACGSPEDMPTIGAEADAEISDKNSSDPPPQDSAKADLPTNLSQPPPSTTDITAPPPQKMPYPAAAPPSSLAPSQSLAPTAVRITPSRSRSLSSAPAHLPASSSLAPPDPQIGRPRAWSGTFESARRSARLRTGSQSPLPPKRTL